MLSDAQDAGPPFFPVLSEEFVAKEIGAVALRLSNIKTRHGLAIL